MTTPIALRQLAGDYPIDPVHTRIGFVARHAMVTKVRGLFTEFAGTAHLDAEDPVRSWVTVTIQARSIDTRNAQRDAELRDNDFLRMDEYPEITFSSTRVDWTGPDAVEITGDLTVKGVTRPVTVPFRYQGQTTDPSGNPRIRFAGSTTINRKDFGVTWSAALEAGGMLVGDKVVLEFEVSAVRN